MNEQGKQEWVSFDIEKYAESLIDEALIDEAIAAYNKSFEGGQRGWMRAAILSALIGINRSDK